MYVKVIIHGTVDIVGKLGAIFPETNFCPTVITVGGTTRRIQEGTEIVKITPKEYHDFVKKEV